MIVADDQDGVPIVFCTHHPDEPATSEDLNGNPLCDCARGYDFMHEAAREWDDNDES